MNYNTENYQVDFEPFKKLTLINPDSFLNESNISNLPTSPAIYPIGSSKKLNVKNMPYDEEIYFQTVEENNIYPPTPPSTYCSDDELEYSNSQESSNVAIENFDFIEDKNERKMIENAWRAITETNMWEFVAQKIDSFMFTKDSRVDLISKKMEELGYKGHSGVSFGCTMRKMQYLAQNGEEKFKKMYERPTNTTTIKNNVLDYMGGY
jgi:hypothetical protein